MAGTLVQIRVDEKLNECRKRCCCLFGYRKYKALFCKTFCCYTPPNGGYIGSCRLKA
ncbi:hypothetical protein V1L52_02595 [Treponema sp. HNW]|uniref:hypothetical protein n=1 Tax=Treponema sp. HNW TaxID=3116654 RepID=UPI003D1400B3